MCRLIPVIIKSMEAKKKKKQEYLYKEIIEKGYDSAAFVGFMQSQRQGGTISSTR